MTGESGAALGYGLFLAITLIIGVGLGIIRLPSFSLPSWDEPHKSCGMTQTQIDALDRENKRIAAAEDVALNARPGEPSYWVSNPDTWRTNGDKPQPAYTISGGHNKQKRLGDGLKTIYVRDYQKQLPRPK